MNELHTTPIAGSRWSSIGRRMPLLRTNTPRINCEASDDIAERVDHAFARFAEQFGPDVPLHFTAFHPDYKMLDVAPTSPATLTRARAMLSCRIDADGDARGTCPHCGCAVAGRFGAFERGFGRRRIPVRVAA